MTFSTIEPVTERDIVLAEEHLGVLQRNVIDLHTRREILEANGVPSRRGILLHGPPGTGKTFACRYLCHKLEGVTRIFVGSKTASIVSWGRAECPLRPRMLIWNNLQAAVIA